MHTHSVSLPTGSLFRLARDIFVEELTRSRRDSFSPSEAADWTPDSTLDAGGLALDSLERFTLAARLNEQFHLYESGVEDNLLRAKTLGDTVEVIAAGRDVAGTHISFFSGGTTGEARVVTHRLADLQREADELAKILGPAGRVIVTVPVHHIYGFIFGVLLPDALAAAVVDAQHSLLGGAARPHSGDIVVSVPFLWQRLPVASWGGGVRGTSSTAPLDPATAGRLGAGMRQLLEVYGSSETSGVGRRDHAASPDEPPPFTLLSRWQRRDDHLLDTWSDPPLTVEPPDHLDWVDDRRFLPRGRRDAVVQVGGLNVDLEQLRERVKVLIPEADDLALRPDGSGRIRLFLAGDVDQLPDDAELRRRLASELDAAALPSSVARGPHLPRTAMGKLADW